MIKAYETWGYEMADHMHGMFAFALWDEEKEELFCFKRSSLERSRFIIMMTEDGAASLWNDDSRNHGTARI